MSFSIQQLAKILPGNSNIKDWFNSFARFFPDAELDTIERIAAFIAECSVESGNFTRLKENLNYGADGLVKTWPKRFPNIEFANQYARQPEKIANYVYAYRMGNGDETSGDGWKYIGRGIIQLTGKNNYQLFADSIGQPIEEVCDYLLTTDGATQAACWFWKTNSLNHYLETQGIDKVSRIINGGDHGLLERRANYLQALQILQS
jgi:putative chitinase